MRKIRYKISVPALMMVALLAAGCSSDTKKALGLSKQVPDEFSIITNNPLVVPPEFELPQPSDVSSERLENKQEEQAKTALAEKEIKINTPLIEENKLFTGFASLGYEDVSSEDKMLSALDKANNRYSSDKKGDNVLVAKMKADPEIRKKVTEDYDALVAESNSFAKKLLFWQDHDVEKKDLIDAADEKKRIDGINAVSGQLDGGVHISK